MKKSLKRLKQNKGSVLFLVLAVMTVLIIAASAVYYMVISNRKTVETRYYDEQAYQTALSVSNGVSEYIDAYFAGIAGSSGNMDGSNELVNAIIALEVNESITTSTVDPTFGMDVHQSLSDYRMGEFEVTITKTDISSSGDDKTHTFKIETTGMYNGQKITLVEIKCVTIGPAEYFTRFFTSTGYRQEDVRIEAGAILTDAYFENDCTFLGTGNTHVNANVYATGTLIDEGLIYNTPSDAEIIVGKNFYVTSSRGAEVLNNGGTLMVGGNYINGVYTSTTAEKAKWTRADEIYVLGDAKITTGDDTETEYYINGDCYIYSSNGHNRVFYINGDLYLGADGVMNTSCGTFYVGGNVYTTTANTYGRGTASLICYAGNLYDMDGNAITDTSPYTSMNFTKSGAVVKPWDSDSVMLVANEIATKTARQNYELWEAEEYFNNNFPSAPQYTFDGSSKVNYINESCILNQPTWSDDTWAPTIIIEATESDIYVYLKPPAGSNEFYLPGNGTNILVKGKRSVIFIVPEGVNFQTGRFQFIGHIGWAEILTGRTEDDLMDGGWQNLKGGMNIAGVVPNAYNANETFSATYLQVVGDCTLIKRNAMAPDLHNNIFMVTSGKDNVIAFDGNQSCLWGYIYAPYATFSKKSNTDILGHVGGMIMGTYTYTDTMTALAFTTPYDYHNLYGLSDPADIVKHLMGSANGPGGSSSSAVALKSWSTIAYVA